MPVISAPWGAKVGDHLSPGVRDQPEQGSKTPSRQKIKKFIQAWWRTTPVVPATQEAEARKAEVAVSRDHTTALQPGQQK